MERDERYEVNSKGAVVVGTPVTLTSNEKKDMIEKMFSINGWKYTLLEEVTSLHYYIELKNDNLQTEKRFHLYHGNVRREDPERNREEKKIQLGKENDPRQHLEDALILGFYVFEKKDSLEDTIVVAWPVEPEKNYHQNPSLRVNMNLDVMPAKNTGFYVDRTTGKNLVVFRPEFIYYYLDNYKDLHYSSNKPSNLNFNEILNHNLYGIHIKQKNDALSEEHPHVCIGWSSLGDLSGIDSRERLGELYDKHIQKESLGRGQDVGQIWRFLNDINVGDYIIFADSDVCHIGKIKSDYYFDSEDNPNESSEYKNKRNVEWLMKNIPRESLSTNFHRSLSTGMSLWGLNDYKSSVFALLNGTYVKDEIFDIEDEFNSTPIPAKEQRDRFLQWLNVQRKDDGEFYSQNTINSYIGQMERVYSAFEKFNNYDSPFQIQSSLELKTYTNYLFAAEGFSEFNDRAGNRACEYGFKKYGEFLACQYNNDVAFKFNTGIKCELSRNRIIFGAPGTGKSFNLNKETKELVDKMGGYTERVTFHPDYSYANFVGTYKPVPKIDKKTNDEIITYEYVPGPFMRVLVSALKNSTEDIIEPHVLIIEEINRANVAAVFGDVFQLLDRTDNNVSEYYIQASEDMKKYLSKELKCPIEKCAQIRIPDNMFIWATMNSADQGVFPMDTAFKRRWDFTYLCINAGDEKISGKYVTLGKGDCERFVEWNKLRRVINDVLSSREFKINEDKLMGPYFLSTKVVPEEGEIDQKKFIDTFKSKVIMYLFEDAAKQKKHTLFSGCSDTTKYSSICDEFDEKGVFIFCKEIYNEFPAPAKKEGENE